MVITKKNNYRVTKRYNIKYILEKGFNSYLKIIVGEDNNEMIIIE